MKPTETDIQIAKQYLLERLDAERSMLYHLERLMRKAAEDIVALLYAKGISVDTLKYNRLQKQVEESINEIILNLQESIADIFETLAIADHEENRNTILPFILGENHGMTFDERLTDYVGKYKNELMVLIGAGLLLGIGKSALAKSIGDNLRQPYANPMLKDGIEAPLTYGRGRSNSMYNAINTLTRFGIGRGWMYDRHLKAEMERAQGFMTFRNSSCACDQCDEYASYMHPMDDPIPPLHANCVCGTIYFNAFGEPIRF